jgi:hypothetical protein
VGVAVRLEYQPELELVPFTGLVPGGEDRQLSLKVALDGAPVPLFEVFLRDGRELGAAQRRLRVDVCGSASKQDHQS